MASERDISRCDACKGARGIGATITVRRTYGIETVYICATCAGRVADVLRGAQTAGGGGGR